jgi:histone acetyltransferase 1
MVCARLLPDADTDNLFRQEILVQLEKDERLEKLEETFRSVRDDYTRILGMIR